MKQEMRMEQTPTRGKDKSSTAFQPKTGAKCSCKRGVQRDNCSTCEGTGWVIDFRAIHARRMEGAK